jgi:hypothetical protein
MHQAAVVVSVVDIAVVVSGSIPVSRTRVIAAQKAFLVAGSGCVTLI